jgi:hypothetical protein
MRVYTTHMCACTACPPARSAVRDVHAVVAGTWCDAAVLRRVLVDVTAVVMAVAGVEVHAVDVLGNVLVDVE